MLRYFAEAATILKPVCAARNSVPSPMRSCPSATRVPPLGWKLMKSSGIGPPVAALLSFAQWARKSLSIACDLGEPGPVDACLLYTSDAADDLLCVDLGGRRIIKK